MRRGQPRLLRLWLFSFSSMEKANSQLKKIFSRQNLEKCGKKQEQSTKLTVSLIFAKGCLCPSFNSSSTTDLSRAFKADSQAVQSPFCAKTRILIALLLGPCCGVLATDFLLSFLSPVPPPSLSPPEPPAPLSSFPLPPVVLTEAPDPFLS